MASLRAGMMAFSTLGRALAILLLRCRRVAVFECSLRTKWMREAMTRMRRLYVALHVQALHGWTTSSTPVRGSC